MALYDLYKTSDYGLRPYASPTAKQSWWQMSPVEQMAEMQRQKQTLAGLPDLPEKRAGIKSALKPLMNTLQIVFGILNIPSAAMSGAAKQLADGVPGFDAKEYFKDVFGFTDQVSWRDVIGLLAERDVDENMWDRKWAQITFGLLADIATDPLTWTGPWQVLKKTPEMSRFLDDVLKPVARKVTQSGGDALAVNKALRNIERAVVGKKWGFRTPWKGLKPTKELPEFGKMVQKTMKGLGEPAFYRGAVEEVGARAIKSGVAYKKTWYDAVDRLLFNWAPGYKFARKALSPKMRAIQPVIEEQLIRMGRIGQAAEHTQNAIRESFKGLDEAGGEIVLNYMADLQVMTREMSKPLRDRAAKVSQFIIDYEKTDLPFDVFYEELLKSNDDFRKVLKPATIKYLQKLHGKAKPETILKMEMDSFDQFMLKRLEHLLEQAGIKGKNLSMFEGVKYEDMGLGEYLQKFHPEWTKGMTDEQLVRLEAMKDVARGRLDAIDKLDLQYGLEHGFIEEYLPNFSGARQSTGEGSELGTAMPWFLQHKTSNKSYAEFLRKTQDKMVDEGFARSPAQAKRLMQQGTEEFGKYYFTIQEMLYHRELASYKAIFARQFLERVGRDWGMHVPAGVKLPANMIRLDDDIPWLGKLGIQNTVFERNTGEFIKRWHSAFSTDKTVNEFVKKFDNVVDWWKILVTTPNPGFHFRNAYSSAGLGWAKWGVEYFDPRVWKQAKKLIAAAREFDDDALQVLGLNADDIGKEFLDATWNGVTNREILRMYKNTEVIHKRFLAQDKLIEKSPLEFNQLKKIAKMFNLAGKESALVHVGNKIGGDTESMVRTVGALVDFRRTNNLRQSAFTANEVMVNYRNLTEFERQIGRRVFPFWSWMKQNTENQVRFIFTQPGRYSKIPKVVNAIEPDKKLPERLRPPYFQDLWMWQLPLRLPDGNSLFFNPDFPFKDLRNLNPLTLDKTVMQAIGPFIKMPIELIPKEGYDIFRRQRIVKYPGYKAPIPGILQTFAQALPEGTLEQMGVQKDFRGRYTMPPKMAHAITSLLPFVRNTSRILMQEPTAIPADKYFQWASYMLGVKIKPVDKLTQEYYATVEEIQRRKDRMKELGM